MAINHSGICALNAVTLQTMEQGVPKQMVLPAILSKTSGTRQPGLSPAYGSSYGRITGGDSEAARDPMRRTKRMLSEGRSQDLAPRMRSKASHHWRSSQLLVGRRQHKSSHCSKIAKSISLPQLPPVPTPFDTFLLQAKRAVVRKRIEARWAPEAVCERYEATKSFYKTRQEDMMLRHASRPQQSITESPWSQPIVTDVASSSLSPGNSTASAEALRQPESARRSTWQCSPNGSASPSPRERRLSLPGITINERSSSKRGAVETVEESPNERHHSEKQRKPDNDSDDKNAGSSITSPRARTSLESCIPVPRNSTASARALRQPGRARRSTWHCSPNGSARPSPRERHLSLPSIPSVTPEQLLMSSILREKFERAWYEFDDPSGFEKQEARDIFSIFMRMVYEGDNELHKDELPVMVSYFGYSLSDESSIARTADEITQCTTMSFEQFLKFLHTLVEHEQVVWQDAFHKYDQDKSGSIELKELRAILHDLGYSPMRNTLQEALEAVDSDQSGHIDFPEFKILMSNWRSMGGLTKEEFVELKELFERFDSDNDGELTTEDKSRLKRYLGFREDKPQSDPCRSQKFPVGWTKFLGEIRRCREQEVKHFRQLFDKQDADKSGELDSSEILKVFESCGFEPLKKRLTECIEQVDEDGSGSLNFEEFVHIMWLYRRTEGFTGEELAELEAIFKRFDHDDSGEVSTLELGDLLRYEGYQPNLELLHHLCAKFDVDGTGGIGLREFYKIMRSLREKERQNYRTLFIKHDTDESQTISTKEIGGVLKELGKEVSLKAVEEAIYSVDHDESGDLDWDEFVELMEKYRKIEVREKRRRCGFTDDKVLTFREQFRGYDTDSSDDLDPAELMTLLADLRLAPRTAFEQMQMMSTLDHCRELAEEKEGKTTFWVFLRLLRILEDDQDRGSIAVERKAAEKAGFNQDEVRDFREIFTNWHATFAQLGESCGAAPTGKALTTEGIARILRSLGVTLPATSDFTALDTICRSCDLDGSGFIDFPDFLGVMRQLLDVNFRNILGHTGDGASY